jgi:hypothetical protein
MKSLIIIGMVTMAAALVPQDVAAEQGAPLKTVELQLHYMTLDVCVGKNVVCTYATDASAEQPKTFDIPVPDLADKQRILITSFQAPRPADASKFGYLKVDRANDKHLRLTLGGLAGIKVRTTIEVQILTGNERDIAAELSLTNTVLEEKIKATKDSIPTVIRTSQGDDYQTPRPDPKYEEWAEHCSEGRFATSVRIIKPNKAVLWCKRATLHAK